MPEYKRQHTVPEFYLKRFSKNEKNINVWNISQEQKINRKARNRKEMLRKLLFVPVGLVNEEKTVA